jgi:hypothetical protein
MKFDQDNRFPYMFIQINAGLEARPIKHAKDQIIIN